MRLKFLFSILLSASFIVPVPGFAKILAGTVTAVDAENSEVEIAPADSSPDMRQKVRISGDISFTGVTALGEVQLGDRIALDAEQDPQGNWIAGQLAKL